MGEGKTHRLGRTPKADSERLKYAVRVGLTSKDFEDVKQEAKRANLGWGAWIRQVVITALASKERDRGQSIIELALVLPVVLLLLGVVVTVGQLLTTSIDLAQAARAGALAAQQAYLSSSDQSAAAESAVAAQMGRDAASVTTSVSDSTDSAGQVVVKVSLSDPVTAPFSDHLSFGPVHAEAVA